MGNGRTVKKQRVVTSKKREENSRREEPVMSPQERERQRRFFQAATILQVARMPPSAAMGPPKKVEMKASSSSSVPGANVATKSDKKAGQESGVGVTTIKNGGQAPRSKAGHPTLAEIISEMVLPRPLSSMSESSKESVTKNKAPSKKPREETVTSGAFARLHASFNGPEDLPRNRTSTPKPLEVHIQPQSSRDVHVSPRVATPVKRSLEVPVGRSREIQGQVQGNVVTSHSQLVEDKEDGRQLFSQEDDKEMFAAMVNKKNSIIAEIKTLDRDLELLRQEGERILRAINAKEQRRGLMKRRLQTFSDVFKE